jgi:hypothetical protein
MIAALYVETDGTYYGLPDVDPWDQARDARRYAGPHPVVAHPPCQRWGRMKNGGPSLPGGRIPHHDEGCFAAAMKAKLAKKRAEGRGGWEDKNDCSNAFLTRLLREHIDKGDPVDVGNLAMMIHQRGERIGR